TRLARLSQGLPAKYLLDRIASRTSVLPLPTSTFGVVCGAIWAVSVWRRSWARAPSDSASSLATVVWPAYLHRTAAARAPRPRARSTAGWRGKPAAWIDSAGFACIVFNFFFVNLVTTGLHSYAGV